MGPNSCLFLLHSFSLLHHRTHTYCLFLFTIPFPFFFLSPKTQVLPRTLAQLRQRLSDDAQIMKRELRAGLGSKATAGLARDGRLKRRRRWLLSPPKGGGSSLFPKAFQHHDPDQDRNQSQGRFRGRARNGSKDDPLLRPLPPSGSRPIPAGPTSQVVGPMCPTACRRGPVGPRAGPVIKPT